MSFETNQTNSVARYQKNGRDTLELRSRPPFTGVLLGPRPESAPPSAFWAILGTCLGVPKECFLSAF